MRPELDDTQAASPSDPERTATQSPGPAAAPASSELPPGLRLGHFRIERKLGAGGMGEVYLGTDLALDRPVAIKVLPAGTSTGTARERLIREARAQAQVQHANVAHIYFIGEDAGRLYFAMEYVTGQTLAARIADGPMPVEDALAVLRDAVLGLREAQRSGFTHRDVKPSNLMVDSHGVVKVLDFGLAAGAPDRASEGPVAQTTLAGTPLYMAPEQARGEPVDLRADIYALGATLYHLVSGRPPFQADSVDELLTLHATAARPSVPRGANPRTAITAVDGLIARMMAPRPEDRFASYDELLRALELASAQHTRPAGFWVRTIATGIDLFGVLLVSTLVSAALGLGRELGLASLLALATVYGVGTIGQFGTTLGKALFELEVVSVATARRPGWVEVIRRELALTGVPLVLSALAYALGWFRTGSLPRDLVVVLALCAGAILVLLLLLASIRSPGKRAPWDRFAGTMVRYRTGRRRA